MDEKNYIPASEIISIDSIPDSLGFVKENLNSLLSEILISELISDISIYGDSTFYGFNLVFLKKISIEIMDANGLALVLNPDGERTEIPITIGYSIPVLKYIENFNLTEFDFSPSSFFDLIFGIVSISDEMKLDSVINLFSKWNFINYEEDDRSPDEIFVDDFNARFNPATPLELLSGVDIETMLEDLVIQLKSNGNEYDINEVIFLGYILDAEAKNVIYKIEDFFNPFLGNFTLENIKDLLIPKISASLNNITLAIEFPRTWLKPLDSAGDVIADENIKSMIRFNVGSLRFSTENGFEFDSENSFSFDKSEIGDTGLTLYFNEMKLDLSKNSNIPEATAAGYPNNFKGVFAGKAEIGLPSKWFNSVDNTTLQIAGYNMLIGTGGISGRIALEAVGGDFKSKDIHRKRLKEKFSQIIFRLFFLQNLYCKAA
jgi:hypothetical protein